VALGKKGGRGGVGEERRQGLTGRAAPSRHLRGDHGAGLLAEQQMGKGSASMSLLVGSGRRGVVWEGSGREGWVL
jgi:hypothetical protein